MNRVLLTFSLLLLNFTQSTAQYPGWQQAVDYTMDITVDTSAHQYTGFMKVVLRNNSPEALDKAYFHLFFNAFQPGSMMDVRSRTISDPDRRVGSRIFELPEEEWGWIKVASLSVNGKPVAFEHDGTLLDVTLNSAIKVGKKATFEMKWTAQVPRQIRRSGWMNKEGVEYSMTQWYPKLCEFDHDGWHTEPYIGREYHGIWGDYDVTINLPIGYEVGGTGELVGSIDAAREAGTWRFMAEDVIDFAWAADPDYVHTATTPSDVTLHFYHQPNAEYDENWDALPEYTAKAMAFLNDLIGPYPYPQYSVIQGGDGGMEYPMATLITGNRSLRSLVGVTLVVPSRACYQRKPLRIHGRGHDKLRHRIVHARTLRRSKQRRSATPGSICELHQPSTKRKRRAFNHPRRSLPNKPSIRCKRIFQRRNTPGSVGVCNGR